jgi:hypothetical protein
MIGLIIGDKAEHTVYLNNIQRALKTNNLHETQLSEEEISSMSDWISEMLETINMIQLNDSVNHSENVAL